METVNDLAAAIGPEAAHTVAILLTDAGRNCQLSADSIYLDYARGQALATWCVQLEAAAAAIGAALATLEQQHPDRAQWAEQRREAQEHVAALAAAWGERIAAAAGHSPVRPAQAPHGPNGATIATGTTTPRAGFRRPWRHR